MKVLIVGGGVIGVATGHELQKRGAEVTVVDRSRVGGATSFRNAGWIVPSMSGPLPAPGVVREGIRWMLRSDSPLLIRPRLNPSFLWWLWRFWRNSRTRYVQGLDATLRLARGSADLFDEYVRSGLPIGFRRSGLLLACLSPMQLEKEAKHLDFLRTRGYDGAVDVMSGESLAEQEPALRPDIAGGLLVAEEGYVDPLRLTTALASDLVSRGGNILEHVTVLGLSRLGGEWRADTTRGLVTADRVVIAAGVWSRRLLRSLGVRIPLEAGKGYSITSSGEGTRPSRPIGLMEAKVACTPFAAGVRLAGTMELAGIDPAITRSRIDAIIRNASLYLRDWRPTCPYAEWAGLRPLVPDGLPIIGGLPGLPGIFIATGHGMLGVTLAPATAREVAPLVLGEHDSLEHLKPFSPGRFMRPS